MATIAADDLCAIGEVIARYSYAMDHRRWHEMDEVFLVEAEIQMGDMLFRGRDKGVAAIRAFIECCSLTHHMNSNLLILSTAGDAVRTISNFRAWHRGKGPQSAEVVECLGTYTDHFRRTGDSWRIIRREETSPIVIGDLQSFFAGAAPIVAAIANAT